MTSRRLLLLVVSISLWTAYATAQEVDWSGRGRQAIDGAARLVEGARNRFVGLPGNEAACRHIEQRLEGAGVPWGKLPVELATFRPGQAWLTVAGRRIRIHTLLHNWTDLGLFDSDRLEGRVVYLGRGTLDEMQGKAIRGNLCLFDFDCGTNYLDAMKLGALGVLLLEPENYWPPQAFQKMQNIPFTVPRYQVTGQENCRFLKQAASVEGGVPFTAEVTPNRWQRTELPNYWAMVEGTDPVHRREMVVLHANIDSMHYCPELPSGGAEAMNLWLLLDLLDRYRRDPPKRSVLFLALNADHYNRAGATTVAWHLFAPREDIFVVDPARHSQQRVLRRDLEEVTYLLEQYEALAPQRVSQAVIERVRDTRDKPAGRILPLADPLIRRVELKLHHIEQQRIRLLRDDKLTDTLKEQFRGRVALYADLVALFNRFGHRTTWDGSDGYRQLSDRQKELFEQFRRELMDHLGRSRQRLEMQLERLETVARARKALHLDGDNPDELFSPIVALGLSASYGSRWIGVNLSGTSQKDDFGETSNKYWKQRNRVGGDFISRLQTLAGDNDQLNDAVLRQTGVRFPINIPYGGIYRNMPGARGMLFFQQGVPAWEILSPFDVRGTVMHQDDRIERLDPETVGRVMAFQRRMLRRVIDDPQTTRDLRRRRGDRLASRITYRTGGSAEVVTRVQDGSSIGVPKTVLEDGLVVVPLLRVKYTYAVRGGMLSYRLRMSDVRGRAFVYNLPSGSTTYLEVFGHDENGRIDLATDDGLSSRKYLSRIIPDETFREFHLLVGARGRKADLYDLFHPKTYRQIGSPILEGEAGGLVERYAVMGFFPPSRNAAGQGYACLLVPPWQRVKVLLTGEVSLIGATPEHPMGRGYLVEQLDRRPVPELAARDAITISGHRIEILNRNAVTNQLMDRLHRRSRQYVYGQVDSTDPVIDDLRREHNHLEAFRRTMAGYGTAYAAYPVVNQTVGDMMKAVVFYLAMLIPFSFFTMKLVFSFVKVQAQIAAFAGVFLGTYLVFHAIHPAFRVAEHPQVVLIAFVMLVLAGFVAFAMKGKFDYHMESFKERFLSGEDVGVLKLAGTAMLVGVTNMKRRRLRTALTCITIMLVTFTMLSFTSISQSVDPTVVRKEASAPYNGVFYSKQSWQGLGGSTIDTMQHVLGRGFPSLVRGFRAYKQDQEGFVIDPDTGQDIALKALLALQPEEDGWLAPMPMVGGRFFEDEEAEEVIVTDVFARDLLGIPERDGRFVIPEGKRLNLNGLELSLVGVIRSGVGDGAGSGLHDLKDLRGSSIVPQVTGQMNDPEQIANTVMEGQEVEEGTFRDVGPQYYVIVPTGLRVKLGVPVVSVSVKMPDSQPVWDRVLEFVNYCDNKVYFGAVDQFVVVPGEQPVYELPGRYYLGSGFSTSIGGLTSLIIPLLVACTIIFNTMLGSVYERRREIDIFNAIGLNPIHIGLFFVAEALVYGIIGGVGGYLIGQLLARGINAMNLMQDINLNYSSLSVVYVIVLTIFIVVASTLYPAWVAIRTATTSSGRRRLEPTDDDHLSVRFPFSFTREMALAVNVYLKEYFDKHEDSSVGSFVASDGRADSGADDQGRPWLKLIYDVALTPYDLGVTQVVTLETRYRDEVGAFMVEARVERLSGQENNWIGTNRPFLDSVRKYLMHWRLVPREDQGRYYESALTLFGLPTTSAERTDDPEGDAAPAT